MYDVKWKKKSLREGKVIQEEKRGVWLDQTVLALSLGGFRHWHGARASSGVCRGKRFVEWRKGMALGSESKLIVVLSPPASKDCRRAFLSG
jgi:hypothetical protein